MDLKTTIFAAWALTLPTIAFAQSESDSKEDTSKTPAMRGSGEYGNRFRRMRESGAGKPNRGNLPGGVGPRDGQMGQQRPQIDPEQLAQRLMSQFDEDGDSRLDSAELTTLLSEMRGRMRGLGAGPGGSMPGSRFQARPGGDGPQLSRDPSKRRGKGKGRPGGTNEESQVGGDDPIRPVSKT